MKSKDAILVKGLKDQVKYLESKKEVLLCILSKSVFEIKNKSVQERLYRCIQEQDIPYVIVDIDSKQLINLSGASNGSVVLLINSEDRKVIKTTEKLKVLCSDLKIPKVPKTKAPSMSSDPLEFLKPVPAPI
eukprot:NODE_8826_length_643_cov_15.757692_g8201_i0.p1 GENE.NODE_8826_length_643_cov_15.757692_g8201_i0~~NODE_8826_length_643_cov_15.757692_g8201_i0.p1  ORF type:complete len:132 (-),score=8.76 NODE_8826_length_643_cov_15.757692_g8201_i0:35-430(-)